MPKLRIEIPAHRSFEMRIPVRITDVNYGNHVGNDAMVSIIHEARMQWLASGGFTELHAGAAGLIMAGLAVEYKAEAFYGDILDVSVAVAEMSAAAFTVFYEVSALREMHKVLIARAQTNMVCFDYGLKKVTAMDTAFAEFLQR